MNKPNRIHLRHCLRLFFDQGKTAAEAKRILCHTYGEGTVSASMCKRWYSCFRNGEFDIANQNKSGGSSNCVDRELWALILENTAMTTEELAKALGVNQSVVSRRLDAIGVIEEHGKLMQRQLDQSELNYRANFCLSLCSSEHMESFLCRIVTGCEKWIKFNNSRRGKRLEGKVKRITSTAERTVDEKKVLLCVWWDQEGVLYHELLQPQQAMNTCRYSAQLPKLKEALQKKRTTHGSNLNNRVILMQENIGKQVTDICVQLDWEWTIQPMFSSDICPSDYYLFPSMEQELCGHQFTNVVEIEKWVTDFFSSRPVNFYRYGIHMLPERWDKVIKNHGAYIK
ncbi:hypothetical protein M513_03072 [Trichuris suis]|uniref:Mos1 transposase HTH domain-containing protein n=2 Tax=Trichuris suis TaxID=68888 RepID=A0A085MFF2_9BILA|nr:hypothetical protein M513_03072 [Trichuris suis]